MARRYGSSILIFLFRWCCSVPFFFSCIQFVRGQFIGFGAVCSIACANSCCSLTGWLAARIPSIYTDAVVDQNSSSSSSTAFLFNFGYFCFFWSIFRLGFNCSYASVQLWLIKWSIDAMTLITLLIVKFERKLADTNYGGNDRCVTRPMINH